MFEQLLADIIHGRFIENLDGNRIKILRELTDVQKQHLLFALAHKYANSTELSTFLNTLTEAFAIIAIGSPSSYFQIADKTKLDNEQSALALAVRNQSSRRSFDWLLSNTLMYIPEEYCYAAWQAAGARNNQPAIDAFLSVGHLNREVHPHRSSYASLSSYLDNANVNFTVRINGKTLLDNCATLPVHSNFPQLIRAATLKHLSDRFLMFSTLLPNVVGKIVASYEMDPLDYTTDNSNSSAGSSSSTPGVTYVGSSGAILMPMTVTTTSGGTTVVYVAGGSSTSHDSVNALAFITDAIKDHLDNKTSKEFQEWSNIEDMYTRLQTESSDNPSSRRTCLLAWRAQCLENARSAATAGTAATAGEARTVRFTTSTTSTRVSS